jgi:transcriptional regulator with XRE-family HTH domain
MIGQKLKIIREWRNLSQEYVATQLGVSQNSYSRMENNRTKLKADDAEKLAAIFGISLVELLSGEHPIITFIAPAAAPHLPETEEPGTSNHFRKMIAAKEFELQVQKEELIYLRKQNAELIRLVEKLTAKIAERALTLFSFTSVLCI